MGTPSSPLTPMAVPEVISQKPEKGLPLLLEAPERCRSLEIF